MERFDVCIIGGGIGGASVAYHLAAHARVLLLERESHAGYHSTGRSAAVYSPQYGSLLNRRLTRASGAFLHAPPPGFAPAPLLRPRGFLTLGRADERDAREAALADAADTGEVLESLDVGQIRERIPFLRDGAAEWGLLDRSAEDMDVEALLQGYLRGARAHGATVRTQSEVQHVERDGADWRLHTVSGPLHAGAIVNAAGAWADSMAILAGATPLGVLPHRRTAFVCDVPTGTDLTHCPMTVWAGERFYFKPEAGRLLGSLAEENPTVACDPQPDDLDVAVAVDRIEQVVDFDIRRLVRAWAGLRSFAPDRDPVSGFDPKCPGFYWHAALGGYGIQTSAALGAFAASTLLGQPLPDALLTAGVTVDALSPHRFGTRA